LTVFIPTGAAINPVTKTNWEGVGVVPEVKVPAEEALDKAIELAKVAAEEFRNNKREKYKASLMSLEKALSEYKPGKSADKITEQIKACNEIGLLGEADINMIGYEYLQAKKNSDTAEAVFKINTVLYPESANTYDSYGEALAANGKMDEAIKSYEKAVELAAANKDGNLDFFKENLAKVKAKAAEK
ncbi:MAG: hypothetical protein KDD04_11760, partial [Sinomicrobium sp.]|nr:hypothetical protein [Sinomicrobium sp.]